jgi:catechol 2,3-dioxygenase-like lactoylglutathione lyase family enzyme
MIDRCRLRNQKGMQAMFTLKHPAIDLGIVCSDFDEAYHFYHDLLGLEVVLDIQISQDLATGAGLAPRKFRQVRLKAGNTLLKLMEIDSPPEKRTHDFQAGVRWLTFIIENVPDTVERLKARGVEFLSEPLSAPDAKHVVCAKGPDGMLIEFVQLPD